MSPTPHKIIQPSAEQIDRHLDNVLTHAGSGLRHYTMHRSLELMRNAMRDALIEAAHAQAAGPEQVARQGEPVAWWEYSEQHNAWFLAYTKNPNAKTRPLVFGDASPGPAVPSGWKLVPVEPTREMFMAALDVEHASYDNLQHVLGLQWADMLTAAPTPPAQATPELPIELADVSRQIEEGKGCWCSCTGCHDLNEGVPTGPFSQVFQCHLGLGCSECGGLGAIWDDTDYEGMAAFMASSDSEPAQPAVPESADTPTWCDGARPPFKPGPMDAEKAAYFMRRFKSEEKLLGPNEQAAIDFVLSMLEQPAVPEDVAGDLRCGNLPTLNQDDYPGLGDWWVQIWQGQGDAAEVVARVYGGTPFVASKRAEAVIRAVNDAAPKAGSPA